MKKLLISILLTTSIILSGCVNNPFNNKIEQNQGGFVKYENIVSNKNAGTTITGADTETLKILYIFTGNYNGPQQFAKDKNYVYGDNRILFSGFDYDTLTFIGDCPWGCFKDKNDFYYWIGCDNNVCEYKTYTGFDLNTLKSLGGNKWEDKNNIYIGIGDRYERYTGDIK